ncbi:hypothetical protein LINGRAHAP2_LOCUS7612 [Linum grandiflorum]
MLWCLVCSKLNISVNGIFCQLIWVTDQAMSGEAFKQPKRW